MWHVIWQQSHASSSSKKRKEKKNQKERDIKSRKIDKRKEKRKKIVFKYTITHDTEKNIECSKIMIL